MTDRRSHRGQHPQDGRLFAPEARPALLAARRDLCWLLSRGYAARSSLKLVGDRYALAQRQRIAVNRCACSDEDLEKRRRRRVALAELEGEELWIDGLNLLTTVEAGLSAGVILHGRDGCFRDMASVHGSYRRVRETVPALRLIGETLAGLGVAGCRWLLDSPVSNSGRLKGIIVELAEEGWPWEAELVPDPDPVLAESPRIIATADSGILDRGPRWANLARAVVEGRIPDAVIVDLSPDRTALGP